MGGVIRYHSALYTDTSGILWGGVIRYHSVLYTDTSGILWGGVILEIISLQSTICKMLNIHIHELLDLLQPEIF